jgi:hypothetical protein
MVLHDEAHHAYRPAPVGENEQLTDDDRAEREEAIVWISGFDAVSSAVAEARTYRLRGRKTSQNRCRSSECAGGQDVVGAVTRPQRPK